MMRVTHLIRCFIPLLILSPALPAQEWSIDCVHCPKQFEAATNRSLCLDENGYPHIAAGGDHLYYTWFDGSSWQSITVDDSPRSGSAASLALDSQENPHICYQDFQGGYTGRLKYARYTGSTWLLDDIDSSSGYISLVLDSSDKPHVSYYNPSVSSFGYAFLDESEWHIQYPDTTEYSGWYSSLDLDDAGFPHIGYGDGSNHSLKYAFMNGEGWHIHTVDNDEIVGDYVSLVLDESGFPHIGYFGDWEPGLKYAYLDESGWHIQVIDDGLNAGKHVSIALDSSGFPHFSYRADDDLKYGYRDTSGWRFEIIETAGEQGWRGYSSLRLDSERNPHIVLTGVNELLYIHRDDAGWHSLTLDIDETVGKFCSSAVDASHRMHVAYAGFTGLDYYPDYDLLYASEDGSGWIIERIETEGSIGQYASLAIDGPGNPCISCYDATNGDLRFYLQTEDGWTCETVDSAGNAGTFTHLAMDSRGVPHIAYHDESSGSLKYAVRHGHGWEIETVDHDAYPGYSPYMALGGGGTPHMCYGKNGALIYCHEGENSWMRETVYPSGVYGNRCLIVDIMGFPRIIFVADGGVSLYAYRDHTAWHIEEIEFDNHIPADVQSMSIDGNGVIHVSFIEKDTGSLLYAYRDEQGWHSRLVESAVSWYPWSSLSLDMNWNPHIGYYDDRCGDLKMAHLLTEAPAVPIAPRTLRIVAMGPNPVEDVFDLEYSVGMGSLSESRRLSARIFDLNGRAVKTLHHCMASPGIYSARWNTVDSGVSSGTYLLVVKTDNPEESLTERIVVIR